ncbi:MAG: prolyl oligopeptidase family serine peptidase [Phycisphaerales bacterium]
MQRTLLTAASLVSISSFAACSIAQHSGGTTSVQASAATGASHPTVKNLEFIEQYAATNRFRAGQPTAIKIMPDSSAVLFLRSENGRSFKQDLWMFDVASKQEKLLLTADQLLGGKEENLTPEELARRERMRMSSRGIASYQISEDGKQLLIPMSGNLFLVEYASAVNGKPSVLQLTEKGGVIDPQLSGDGKMVAYVKDGALFAQSTDDFDRGKARLDTRISPAAEGNVSYGEAEFVAQEEMGRTHGFWWSPDSRAIAYQSTDTTGVEIFNIADASDPAKPAQTWPYPRAGTKNADVKLFVQRFGAIENIDFSTDIPGQLDYTLPSPIEVRWDHAAYPYLAKVVWQKHGPLTILVQNRTQTEQVLYAVDEKTGQTRELLQEKDEAWINIQDDVPRYLKDGSFLWMTEQFVHGSGPLEDTWLLQQRSATGSTLRTLAGKGLSLTGLVDVDETAGRVFLTDAYHNPGTSVLSWPLREGEKPSEPGCFGETAQVGAIIKNGLGTWVRTVSSVDAPARWEIMRGDTVAATLSNRAEQPSFEAKLELTQVKFEADTRAHVAIIRPTNFDPSKKYPVLNFAYTGPHSNVVNANARAYLLHQWFADQGFIVVAIDGRGTPRRGRAWERAIKNNLIDVALQDQCDALEALCEKYPEMDRNRIGVSGWSFGGYFSAMATMRRPDVFKAGIAGAPVADWRDYDTHYTERYMGLPDEASKTTDGVPGNKAGYDASSVLTYCKDLTVPLLIIHGTADDNVYFTHSIKMADALTRAGKKFEFLPLAGQTHMVTQPALVKEINARMVEFFKRELGEPK